jgi:hypothetical protein
MKLILLNIGNMQVDVYENLVVVGQFRHGAWHSKY